MAYKIYVQDSITGKTFGADCGGDCTCFESGMYEIGKPIIIPEAFDAYLKKYDPHGNNVWPVMERDMAYDLGVAFDHEWLEPLDSIRSWDGHSVYGVVVKCIGIGMRMWDDIRRTVPSFDDGVQKMFRPPVEVTSNHLLYRFMSTRGLCFGVVVSPKSVDMSELRSNVSKIAVDYASLAMFGLSGTSDEWNCLVSFGSFIHMMSGMAQGSFPDIDSWDTQEEFEELVSNLKIRVEIVDDRMLPKAREVPVAWRDRDNSELDMEEIKRKLVSLLSSSGLDVTSILAMSRDEPKDVDKEVFGDEPSDFWNDLLKE